MSTLVFVDPEKSTQADGAQSPRVPVPFPEDPYKAIRQAYLVETETPESPQTVASPTPLPDSTPHTCHAKDSVDSDKSSARSTPSDSIEPLSPDHSLTHASPTLVPILCRTARMAMRVPPAMSPGLSASISEVASMSDLAFRKRFRSSYKSSPSSSPLDLPSWKRYRGTSELVEDDEEEDEEVEESLDSNNESEDAVDEGPTAEGEDHAAGDEAPVVETAVGEPLGQGYGALRRQEIALGEGRMPSVFEVGQSSRSVPEHERPERVSALRQPTLTTWIDPEDGITYIDVPAYPPPAPLVHTPPSPEWSSGSLPVSSAPSIVPLPISSPIIPLTIPSLVASPATVETEGFLTDDTQRENRELRLQISEERRARLDLAEIVDSMRRGQEPRGDADGAQSPRVPIPFPEDPYEAIRQAYLVETETPESPHTVASPTLLLDNTPPTRHAEDSVDSDTSGARPMSSDFTAPLSANHPLTHTTPTMVPLFHMIARMAVCVPPTMSPGLSASITKVAAISNPAFHKRFGSSYESSPSSSPADLPLRKHFRGTFDLVGVYKEEDNDEEEDEEIEESSDSDSESKGAEDRGGDATVPEGQQRGALVVETAVGEPLGLGYGALRRREIALEEGQMPSIFEVDLEDGIAHINVPTYPPSSPPVQTLPSLEWSSGSLLVSLAPSIVPLPISSPMIPLTVTSHVASPATAKAEGFLTELGAQRYDGDIGELFTRSGAVKDEIFSQRYQFRSLEHEPERVAVTFVAILRPVLALKLWAYQTNSQRAALWHAICDTQMENWELRLHIIEERRARLDLAEIINSMRREQEPRGDV
ncbi:hypothetical protein Tco_1304278 [Tanacetum coccineum]